MATITLTVNNAVVPTIIDALNNHYNGRPAGMTDVQWFKACIKQHIVSLIRERRKQLAMGAALSQIEAETSAVDGGIS
jgi:hypothetical protein